jgi:Ca-activated chloride channel family protein
MKMAEAPQQVIGLPQTAETQPAKQDITKPVATQAASPTIVKTSTNIEIIVDASGSMNGPMGATTKLGAIKEALKSTFSTPMLPEATKQKIALRVFGNKSPQEKNDCTDTALLTPMDKYDPAVFLPALDSVKPQGIAPLAFALESAFVDFKEAGDSVDNLIILITDGVDGCNSDAVAAAERLHKSNKRVIVNVIGFDIDQATADSLKKISDASSGTFHLARSDVELSNEIDQAISQNLPYNLRVRVLSGASPLPSTITIYRTNTQSIVDRAESTGVRFFKVNPGQYDILAEFIESPETAKPSKLVKGVDVTATSKAEQVIQFDLGNLNIAALDQNNKEPKANFFIRKAGSADLVGRVALAQTPITLHLSPGAYEIDAETAEEGIPVLTAQAKDIEIKSGETTDLQIKFLTGKLFIKAQNSSSTFVPIFYRITKPGSEESMASGEGTVEGTTVDLAPGKYDLYVRWTDPNIKGAAEVKVPDVAINGGETLEQLVTIVTGTMKLSGKDQEQKLINTDFVVKKAGQPEELLKVTSEAMPVEVFIAPGKYDITATDTTSKIVPAPTVVWTDVVIKEGQTESFDAVFKLGITKWGGKNAKGVWMPTTFTVFRSGIDEPLVVETSSDWVIFNLTPGLYDVKAEDAEAKSDPKPNIWFHDVQVTEGTTIANEAIFTSGKLKLICRGKNNVVLSCEFNVFSYGSDTALFSGETAEDWKEFDIPPGKYYMEAGWHDPKEEQFLKKWINIEIGENQIVEEILRF